VAPGANLQLQAADVTAHADAIQRAGMVLAQLEIGDAPVGRAFRLARAAGATTLLNPSPCRALPPQLLADTDLLVLNAGEARQLVRAQGIAAPDDKPLTLADTLLRLGPQTVVITLGRAGAVACTRAGERLTQAAFAVPAIDTIGAGDAFAAALAVAHNEGNALAESLRFACAAGALTTLRMGVFDALPTRAETHALLTG
jgi:ribokinase